MDPSKITQCSLLKSVPSAVHVLWVRNMAVNLTFKTIPSVLHQTLYLNFVLSPSGLLWKTIARILSLPFGAFISFFALATPLLWPNVTFPLSYQIPLFTTTHSKWMFILQANLLMFSSVPTHFSLVPFFNTLQSVSYTHSL